MRIALTEIWDFIDLIENSDDSYRIKLSAGDLTLTDVKKEAVLGLRHDEAYDQELLPELFTYREILWQPDVFPTPELCYPGLRILQHYCLEQIAKMEAQPTHTVSIYKSLLAALAEKAKEALALLETNDWPTSIVLSRLRHASFPIIRFFILHPCNSHNYRREALNRLNYSVKIMLSELNGKYSKLEEPYWQVDFQQKEGYSEEVLEP